MISSSVCFFFSSSNSSVRSSPSSPLLSFFLVLSVVVKGEKSSKRKKVAKFLTSFRLAKPLLRLAKEEYGSTNIFFAPSYSLSFSEEPLRPTGRQTERERVKEIRVLLLAWLFLVFFFNFFLSRYKILKYECKTYNIDKVLKLFNDHHAHLMRLSNCSSCIRR